MVYGGVTSVPGKFLLVMEYCPGGSLHDRLMGDGPIAEAAMRQWVFQIAAAMKYAAFRGVFHNDLKPANILLDGSDDAKVADFGMEDDKEDDRPSKRSRTEDRGKDRASKFDDRGRDEPKASSRNRDDSKHDAKRHRR